MSINTYIPSSSGVLDVGQWKNKARALCLILSTFPLAATAGWEVQWIDAFDGEGVNWSNWTAQTQANYNNEVQCYTDDDYSVNRNYDVSGGTLKIIARKQPNNCSTLGGQFKSWTSGRLNSKDKQEFLYGRVETRLRFHNLESGTWPAFWALENRIREQPIKGDNDNVNWPNPGAGEIDIWEWHGDKGDRYITAFHNVEGCGDVEYYQYPNGAQDVLDWHRYSMEWTEQKIDFYVDDHLVVSRDISNCSQYHEPMFLLVNLALGGMLGGSIDPSLELATLEVDYIAHCQPNSESTSLYCDEDAPRNGDTDSGTPGSELQLTLHQNGLETYHIKPNLGKALIQSHFDIADEEIDNYSLYWRADQIPNPIYKGTDLEFDPSGLAADEYLVELTLKHIDSNISDITQRVNFTVQANDLSSETDSNEGSSGGAVGVVAWWSLILLVAVRRKNKKIN
ncbi:glycoside hydrolase family 16 protein [Vibrio parahaemolyticus]|uniref:glycoside hydrolase family 16 protein n=1 Tax=Vibrio mediterranei TaxID=689 RepID=UPI0040693CD0